MTASPDVLFVVLDSARVDRLSTYGHDRETTPALDRLATESTVFENAFTPAPWTLPSHCSVFTGLFPSEHGVTNGFTDRNLELPDDVPTLAERLADHGYRTAGFSNNPWVGQLSALTRGFDEFVEWDLEISRSSTDGLHTRVDRGYSRGHELLGRATRQPLVLLKRRFFTSRLVERARRWIERADGTAPTFTFCNLMEAHSPYYPPASAFRELGLSSPNPLEARLLNVRLLAYVMGKRSLSATQRERVMAYYDASLRYQDAKVAELLSDLRERGRFDETLIVVCADHGKTLGDYDRDGVPPHYLRGINVTVPLFVKWPGQRSGERVEEPVELTRLFELLASGGETSPAELSAPDGLALTEDVIPHTGRHSTDVTRWRALSDGRYRYLRAEDGDEYLLGRRDGREGVVDDAPAVRERLREALAEREAALRQAADGPDDGDGGQVGQAVEGQLKDLGYL